MRRPILFLALAALPLAGAVIPEIRSKISAGDFLSAEALADDALRANGPNSEYADALSWLARGALTMNRPDDAARYLDQSKKAVAELSKMRSVEDDPYLAAAVGANIEVEARLLALRGQRDQAIQLLRAELPRWKTYGLQARIQKNLNLLTLVGKPAPELDPRYRGKPVLLFLWAHWCSDCKAEGPAIARIFEKYGPYGLLVVAPTRRYGRVGDNDHATEEQENAEIESVWKQSYARLAKVEHPVSDSMMRAYGVSATPTLVLIDREGIVRMYEPSRMSDAALERQIDAVLAKR